MLNVCLIIDPQIRKCHNEGHVSLHGIQVVLEAL